MVFAACRQRCAARNRGALTALSGFQGNQTMNSKITLAVAAVLGGTSFATQAAEPASESAGAKDSLEEIVVTATRRSESMQDVPIAMQAFTSEALAQLNVATFDDYVKFVPNITTANNGPGQNEVFMRGLSAGAAAQPGERFDRGLPQRRHLSRQPVRPASRPQSRYLCG